ncbi:TolC family protein [Bdellovibrionota bacterium FG-2]
MKDMRVLRMIARRLLIFVGVGFSLGAWAASQSGPVTLTVAIEEAEGANPVAQKAVDAAEMASLKERESLAAFLPKIGLKADHFVDNKFQVLDISFGGANLQMPAQYPMTTLTLEGSMTLFDGLASWYTYWGAQKEADAGQSQLRRARLQLDSDVKLRFYQAIAAKFLENVAEQNLKTLEEHLSEIKARQRAGFSTQFDVLRIEVQLEEARVEKMASADRVTVSRLRLVQAMGLEQDERSLEGVLPIPSEIKIPEDLAVDLQNRDDLQAQMKLDFAAQDYKHAAQAHWYPRFNIFANTQAYNNVSKSMFESSQFRNAYAIGMSLTWRLFDGGAEKARQDLASLRARDAEHNLRVAQLQIPVEFKTWRQKFFYSVSSYHASLRSVDKAEESVRLARVGLKAGTRTNVEMLDAELDLFRARAGVIKAQVDAVEALISLELALGRKLSV